MDSSAIGVGVAVLVGKCMQGPCSAVPDIRVSDSTETFLTVSYCSQISMYLSISMDSTIYGISYSLCSAVHVSHCTGVVPARPQCSAFF